MHAIEGTPLIEGQHEGRKVTHVPPHAKGNANHPEAESGKIVDWNNYGVMIDYGYKRARSMYHMVQWA